MTFISTCGYTESSLQQFREILNYFKRRQTLEIEYAAGLGKHYNLIKAKISAPDLYKVQSAINDNGPSNTYKDFEI